MEQEPAMTTMENATKQPCATTFQVLAGDYIKIRLLKNACAEGADRPALQNILWDATAKHFFATDGYLARFLELSRFWTDDHAPTESILINPHTLIHSETTFRKLYGKGWESQMVSVEGVINATAETAYPNYQRIIPEKRFVDDLSRSRSWGWTWI